MALQDTDLLPVTRPSGTGAGTYRTTLAALKVATNSVSVGTTAPTNPVNGQLWVDTSVTPPKLQIWNTATSGWAVSSGGGVQAGATAPTSPVNGQLWVDTSVTPPVLKIYDSAAGGKWGGLAGAPPDRAPILGTATLADVTGGARFTNTAFPVVVTVTDAGSPTATMKLRASVFGNMSSTLETDTIASKATTTGPVYSSGTQNDPALDFGSYGPTIATADWTKAFDGNLTTFVMMPSFSMGSIKLATPFALPPGGKVEYYVKGVSPTAVFLPSAFYGWSTTSSSSRSYTNITDATTYATPAWHALKPIAGTGDFNGIGMINGGRDATFQIGIAAVRIDGVLLTDNMVIDSLVLAGNTNFASLTVGTMIRGKTSNATAEIFSLNAATFTVGIANKTGTFQVGEKLQLSVIRTGVTLYTVHNAAGLVSSLQSADPGFTAVTTASPYHVTFPATFPTGNPPDLDLPPGTTLKVELEASNPAGRSAATTNVITPV